jgi:hypothetical protein
VRDTTIKYKDVSFGWPYTIKKSYTTEIPETVRFDVQRTGQFIQFEVEMGLNSSFQICSIGIYGKIWNDCI